MEAKVFYHYITRGGKDGDTDGDGIQDWIGGVRFAFSMRRVSFIPLIFFLFVRI